MFASRQLVTLSASGVVFFAGGGWAIAQTEPTDTATADPITADPIDEQMLLSSVGTMSPHRTPQSVTGTPEVLAVEPQSRDVFASSRNIVSESDLFANVGSLAQPQQRVSEEPRGEFTPALLDNAGVLTEPQTMAVMPEQAIAPVTIPTDHLGSLASPAPLVATKESEQQVFTFEPLAPEGSELVAATQTEPTQPTTAAATPATDIPRVLPLAPERVINEELKTLLEPVENEAVTVPTTGVEVNADNVVELTLEETIRLALERNEDLTEAQLNYERAKYQLREAIAAEYPTLTNQTDITRSETTAGELQAEALGRDESNTSSAISNRLELSYDIYAGGARSAQIDAAATQLKITELEIERITEETRLNAATNYYDLQSADAQTVIEESAVFDANQSLKDAKLLEEAGLGTKFDVLRAEVEVANAQQRLTRANATQKIARRQLAQLLSLEPKIDPRPADEIDLAGQWEIPLEDTIVLALQQRHELRRELLQREIDGYQQQIALSTIRPQVSLFANYDLLDVFKDRLDLADGFSVGARMRWNLFDGGAAAARADQEEVDKAIAENRFISQRNQIRLAVENAYYNLEASEENIKTASVAVTLAEESLRLARMRFNAGVGTQTDVISAQTELNTARGNYLQAVTDYNRAFAQLKREVGLGDAVIEQN